MADSNQKSVENKAAPAQQPDASADKYQEPVGDESAILLEEKEEKSPLIEETEEAVPEPEEKVVKEGPKAVEEKKVEAEPVKESPEAETEPAAEEKIEEATGSAPVPPSAQARKKAGQLVDLDRTAQVKALCDLAFDKGINFAIEVAKALDNAYVLDEFHDALVDELSEKLLEKGELEKV